ncbi:ribonuclease P protein component [bacterium]|nr:ribonuclease P protein component [bacterium]
MLSKKNRLTTERDILRTRKGESAKGAFFVIRVIKNNFGYPRIAVTVGKKVSLKSVERNLIKRQASEAVRLMLPNINSFDVFIFALPDAKKASYKEIDEDVKKLFKKSKITNA